METLKRKLSSRKLWAAIAGFVMGISMVFGLDQNIINTISGAIVSVGSLIAYIAAEGIVDAARIQDAVTKVQDVVEVLDDNQ